MNRVVWTLWTKPSLHGPWISPLAHACAWILSVNLAKKHYDNLVLYTDSKGWEFLKTLNLPFTEVHTFYDDFDMASKWFAAAKMKTLSLQTEPFIHIDNDVFLWNKISDTFLMQNDVVTQSYEDAHSAHYRIDFIKDLFTSKFSHLNFPKEVKSYTYDTNEKLVAVNAGIVAVNNLKLIQRYVDLSLNIIQDKDFKKLWSFLRKKHRYTDGQFMILLEQYTLHAVLYYYKHTNVFNGSHINYDVLLSGELPYMRQRARELGYTHLISGKRNYQITANLVEYVQNKFPRQYNYYTNKIAEQSLFNDEE